MAVWLPQAPQARESQSKAGPRRADGFSLLFPFSSPLFPYAYAYSSSCWPYRLG